VLDAMGRARVDGFARLFVMPQAGHGLSGRSYSLDGEGKPVAVTPIPNAFDRFALLTDWAERKKAPGLSVIVTAGEKSLPLCSYPEYPKYVSGPPAAASSYACSK
jgi:feruloyl esterase